MKLENLNKFHLVRATKNTLEGIKALWRHEKSFRIEVYLCVLLLPCVYWMPIPSFIKLLLILLMLLMLVVEALNSALEAVIDRISTEIHPQSKLAKDMGSAAVGMTQLMNFLAWVYTIYCLFGGSFSSSFLSSP